MTEFGYSKTVTKNNKENLSKLVKKLSNEKLRKELTDKIGSVKMNELDATVEYYLKDLGDKNRFQTAWM